MAKYDAVVVGSGNGGLSTACTLAKAGKKVLIVEKHNLPGGVASSFKRGRFEFESALHELASIGTEENPADVRKLLEQEYGVKIHWHHIPDIFRVISLNESGEKTRDVKMPMGRQEFEDKMEFYAPGNRKAVKTMFELYDECLAALGYLEECKGHPETKVLMKKYPNFLRVGSYPVNKVLQALKFTPDAMKIMSTYWSYMMVDLDHLSSIFYLMMVCSLVDIGAYIPDHTSSQLENAMYNSFLQMGGEGWFNCTAKEVLFDDKKRVCGLKTTQGEIETKHVIWNGNPSLAYANNIPAEVIPERELKLANARKFSARMFVVYIGLNKTAEELGIEDYNIFINAGNDSVTEYNRMCSDEPIKSCAALCYNIVNPNISPKGTCMMSMTTSYCADVWGDVDPKDYFRKKQTLAEQSIALYEKAVGVSLKPYIEEMEVASPWTFCRYAGVPEGGVYGYEAGGWDNCMARMMMYENDYPIEGLMFTGASGPRGDGYSESLITGNMIGKMVLRDMAKEEM